MDLRLIRDGVFCRIIDATRAGKRASWCPWLQVVADTIEALDAWLSTGPHIEGWIADLSDPEHSAQMRGFRVEVGAYNALDVEPAGAEYAIEVDSRELIAEIGLHDFRFHDPDDPYAVARPPRYRLREACRRVFRWARTHEAEIQAMSFSALWSAITGLLSPPSGARTVEPRLEREAEGDPWDLASPAEESSWACE